MTDLTHLDLPDDQDITQAIKIITLFDYQKKTPTHSELDDFDAMRWRLLERYENNPAVDVLAEEIGRVCLFATMENMIKHEKSNSKER